MSNQSLTRYLASNNLATLPLEPSEPCSHAIATHYSFDMAQKVHYTSNPQQPGSMYFLTPRNCGVFGVYTMKQYLNKLTFLLMSPVTWGKEPTTSSQSFTTFLVGMGLGRKMCSFIQVTAQDNIKTMPRCII